MAELLFVKWAIWWSACLRALDQGDEVVEEFPAGPGVQEGEPDGDSVIDGCARYVEPAGVVEGADHALGCLIAVRGAEQGNG